MFDINSKSFDIADVSAFKEKAWEWSRKFAHVAILENNNIPYLHQPFINILAAGAKKVLQPDIDAFNSLQTFCKENLSWIFGYFSYDLKNQIEELKSENHDFLQFPEIFFFLPEHLLFFNESTVKIHSSDDPDKIFQEILISKTFYSDIKPTFTALGFVEKEEYKKNVETIKEHILEGDV